jgi:predicted acyl esterase
VGYSLLIALPPGIRKRTAAAAAVDGNLAEDFFELRQRWFDRWIKRLANGIDEEPPVRVFVMGSGSGRRNRDGRLEHGGYWRSAAEWPLPQTRWAKLYLHADRSLSAAPRWARVQSNIFEQQLSAFRRQP